MKKVVIYFFVGLFFLSFVSAYFVETSNVSVEFSVGSGGSLSTGQVNSTFSMSDAIINITETEIVLIKHGLFYINNTASSIILSPITPSGGGGGGGGGVGLTIYCFEVLKFYAEYNASSIDNLHALQARIYNSTRTNLTFPVLSSYILNPLICGLPIITENVTNATHIGNATLEEGLLPYQPLSFTNISMINGCIPIIPINVGQIKGNTAKILSAFLGLEYNGNIYRITCIRPYWIIMVLAIIVFILWLGYLKSKDVEAEMEELLKEELSKKE